MRQGSCSLKLPHTLHRPTRSFTTRMASARRSASSFGALSRYMASRWALFWPTLGSFISSSTRSSKYFELYMGAKLSEWQVDAAGELAESFLHVGLGGALRLAHRGHDQILQQAGVGLFERLGIELDLDQLAPAIHGRRHHAAAGAGGKAFLLETLLRLGHLLLHLLRLLDQVAEALHRSLLCDSAAGRPIGSPSNHCFARSTSGRTSALGAGASSAVCGTTWS